MKQTSNERNRWVGRVAVALPRKFTYQLLRLSFWSECNKIEGIFTILVGFAFTALIPKSPSIPICLARIRYFSERESQILVRRVLLDDPTKHHAHKNITRQEITRTVSLLLPLSSWHTDKLSCRTGGYIHMCCSRF